MQVRFRPFWAHYGAHPSAAALRPTRKVSIALAWAVLSLSPAVAADILLINGNSNNTVQKGSLSVGDAFVKQRLESVLGHRTRVLWDETPAGEMRAASDSVDLTLVLESVTSASLTTKLKATTTPILNCEAFIQDDLGMTASGPSGDPGPPSQFAFGVLDGQTALDIKDPDHPLAAGLTGRVTIYSAAKEVNWGKVAPAAKVVATLAGDAAGTSIYVYAKGSVLYDGSTAAGLRIGFFLEDDNKTGTPNLMTQDGLKLFDAAVAYALGGTTAVRDGVRAGAGGGGRGTEAIGRPPADALGRSVSHPGGTRSGRPGGPRRYSKS